MISAHEQDRILKLKKDIDDILKQGMDEFHQEKYRDSAKRFRQIASILLDIDSITDKDQNYSDKNTLNDLSGKRWLKSTKSWIIVDGKPSDIPPEIKNHPGSFPPDLAAHFIEFFTKSNHWVLDPFMGIGSTLAACKMLGRNGWGVELNSSFSDYANKRVNDADASKFVLKSFNDDTRNLVKIWKREGFPKADFLITSPPYWNILETSRGGVESTQKKRIKEGLNGKYSENPNDIGNIQDYEVYLNELVAIFTQIKQIMRVGAYICIIVQNVRPKEGIMIPIAWDLARRLGTIFTLRQEYIWCQDQKFLGIWGYPNTYVSNVHHHYCLIFQNLE